MKRKTTSCLLLLFSAFMLTVPTSWTSPTTDGNITDASAPPTGRYLYVAVPGIRSYLGYGGHGILVFLISTITTNL